MNITCINYQVNIFRINDRSLKDASVLEERRNSKEHCSVLLSLALKVYNFFIEEYVIDRSENKSFQ